MKPYGLRNKLKINLEDNHVHGLKKDKDMLIGGKLNFFQYPKKEKEEMQKMR